MIGRMRPEPRGSKAGASGVVEGYGAQVDEVIRESRFALDDKR